MPEYYQAICVSCDLLKLSEEAPNEDSISSVINAFAINSLMLMALQYTSVLSKELIDTDWHTERCNILAKNKLAKIENLPCC